MVTSVNWVGNKNPRGFPYWPWEKKTSRYVFPGPKRAEGKAGKLSVLIFLPKGTGSLAIKIRC